MAEFSEHALEKHVLANTLFDSKKDEDHFTSKIKLENVDDNNDEGKILKRGCTQKKTYQTFLHLYLCFVLVELHSKIHHLSVYPFVVFFKMKIFSFHS